MKLSQGVSYYCTDTTSINNIIKRAISIMQAWESDPARGARTRTSNYLEMSDNLITGSGG